jgi:hypothetical protein
MIITSYSQNLIRRNCILHAHARQDGSQLLGIEWYQLQLDFVVCSLYRGVFTVPNRERLPRLLRRSTKLSMIKHSAMDRVEPLVTNHASLSNCMFCYSIEFWQTVICRKTRCSLWRTTQTSNIFSRIVQYHCTINRHQTEYCFDWELTLTTITTRV